MSSEPTTAVTTSEAPVVLEESQASPVGDSLGSAMLLMLLLTVAQRGTGFFRNMVVCRWLEPEELGAWNLAQSFLMLAAPLIVLGIPGAFKRYVAYYEQRNQLRRFLAITGSATILLAIIGVVAMLGLRRQVAWLAFGDETQTPLAVLSIGSLLTVIVFNFSTELLTAMRQVKRVSRIQFGNALIFTAVALVLVGIFGLDARGVVFGYAAACAVSAALAIRAVVTLVCQSPRASIVVEETPVWRKLLPFSAAVWLADLLTNCFSVADRLMIVHFADQSGHNSMAMIGQYHSSQIIGSLLVALTVMLGGVLLSYLSHDWESGHRARAEALVDSSLRQVAMALTTVAGVGLLLAPIMFDHFLSHKYADGLRILPLTMAYCIWFGLISVAQNYLWCRERGRFVSAALFGGLMLNIALNAWWLPVWGLDGAVAATAVANLLSLAIVLICCQILGMRYHPSTLVSVLLPALLCGGGAFALVGVALYGLAGWAGGWLLTADQQSALGGHWDRALRRLGFDRPCDWPSRI
ncbi:MAG: lipopolysaccharide biosynthesis protein [Planctomycetales bacterium]|nr:lipopolysaccharide biosynthesis protein [Planctomycetales bacterium]